MRTLFTALAFLVMLLAVMPALRRCLYPVAKPPEASQEPGGNSNTA
jgi:hypothetical protein